MLDERPIAAPLDFKEQPQPGLRFTERMRGWWSPATHPFDGAPGSAKRREYQDAFDQGRSEGRSLDLVLTIATDDLERTLRDPRHTFGFAGTARVVGLPDVPDGADVLVSGGLFQLFVPDPDQVSSRQMTYAATLTDPLGGRWEIAGFKAIRQGGGVAGVGFKGFRDPEDTPGRLPSWLTGLWADQTRLYVDLWRHGHARERALGILTLNLSDFLRQLLTMRATGTRDAVEAYDTTSRFVLFFGGVLRDTYGGPLARSRYAPPDWWRRRRRRLVGVGPPSVVPIGTEDGVVLKLTRYEGTARGLRKHIILAPGLGVRANSYAIDTVDVNLVEFLAAKDYVVWLFDYRGSPEIMASRDEFSIDHIARFDWPAAVDAVCARAGTARVSVVAHCVGAMSFTMAALGGYLPATKIATAILSQVAAHPVGSRLNELKGAARLATLLELFGKKSLRVTVHAADRYRRPPLDAVLKYYPTSDPCDNPVCRRVRFAFGESYLHANLNRKTHDAIIEMFGNPAAGEPAYVSLRALRHLARILRHERVVHEDGTPYLPAGLRNLEKLQLQLCLMSGPLNAIFPRRGMERTQALLERCNVPGVQPMLDVPGYAHMDCFIGERAHTEVFPRVLARLG